MAAKSRSSWSKRAKRWSGNAISTAGGYARDSVVAGVKGGYEAAISTTLYNRGRESLSGVNRAVRRQGGGDQDCAGLVGSVERVLRQCAPPSELKRLREMLKAEAELGCNRHARKLIRIVDKHEAHMRSLQKELKTERKYIAERTTKHGIRKRSRSKSRSAGRQRSRSFSRSRARHRS